MSGSRKYARPCEALTLFKVKEARRAKFLPPTPQNCCHFDLSFQSPSTEEEDEEEDNEEGEAEDDEAARTGSQSSAVTPTSLHPSEPQQLNPLTVTSATSS